MQPARTFCELICTIKRRLRHRNLFKPKNAINRRINCLYQKWLECGVHIFCVTVLYVITSGWRAFKQNIHPVYSADVKKDQINVPEILNNFSDLLWLLTLRLIGLSEVRSYYCYGVHFYHPLNSTADVITGIYPTYRCVNLGF